LRDGSGEHHHHSPALPIVFGDGGVEFEKGLCNKRRRGSKKGFQYLVKWKGYSIENATWENDCNLERAAEVVSTYW
jgi:hypothetical protein